MIPNPGELTVILLIAIAIFFLKKGIIVVPDGNVRLVERLGRRHKILKAGINVIIPGLDAIRKNQNLYTFLNGGKDRVPLFDKKGNISVAEQRMDPETQKFLCKDNSEVFVDPVCYFAITDAMRAVYDVSSVGESLISMIGTTLRQEVGKYDGDAIIRSREVLSESLRKALQEASTAWGIKIYRVEIEDIHFDGEIAEKLSQARREELIRRAEVVAAQAEADKEVLRAEAEKKATLLRAAADREAAIEIAEGEKQSRILNAEAEFEEERLKSEALFLTSSREQEGLAQGYEAICKAINDHPDAVVALESIKAQINVADSLGKSNNTLIVPSETAGLFGAVAAGIEGYAQIKKSKNNDV